MRLALIFPPSMPPTSPPCGIAYLKAFIGQGTLFDLNLAYHDIAVDMIRKGILPVEAEVSGYVIEPEHLQKAVNFLKGQTREFFDPQQYNMNTTIFINYMKKIDAYLTEQCIKYVTTSSMDDDASHFFDQLLAPVKAYNPDVVGISQLILSQREFVLGLAKMLKEEEVSIIIGGASLWYNPEAYLSKIGTQNIDVSHLIDAAFYGEGEKPLAMYMEGESLEKIPNIVYKNGSIIKNEESGIEDLDTLPLPDFDDFPLKEYYSPGIILPLLTSRGCYWRRCTFCIHHKTYYRYRVRSTEKVIQDLKELQKKYQTSYFCITDEMIHPHRFHQLCSSILQEGLTIRLSVYAKPTRDFSEEVLKTMYRAGVRNILWGVESGTQRILDVIDKGTNVPDIETVLKSSHDVGIWNMIFIIMGYPTQTEEDILNDISFFTRNDPFISTAAKSLFQLEVGSRLYENPEKVHITKVEHNPDPFSPVCYYEVSQGLLNRDAERIYREHWHIIARLSKVSPYFGRLRDHMFLFADHLSSDPLEIHASTEE